MTKQIEAVLNSLGPSLSNKVADALAKRANISHVAARKRLSRAGGNVRKLTGVAFARNIRFMYLKDQYGSPIFWQNLADALIESKSALGYAILALCQSGGMVPVKQFPIVCGSPVLQSKHLAAETVLQKLIEVRLVKTILADGIGECVAFAQEEQYYVQAVAELRARLFTEDILLAATSDWLRKLGLASYNLVTTRKDDILPKVGTFVWDLSAPSYINALIRFSRDGKPKPGFVICDVNLTENMTMDGAAPFIHKCKTLRGLRNVSPCIQIIIANRFDKAAFKALRTDGIIATTPALLFGEEIADALLELISVMTAAAIASFDSVRFERLFRTLSKIEGTSIQLRGKLFEYLVADIVNRTLLGEVTINRHFKVAGKGETEIDVLSVEQNRQITVIECKGYSPRAIIPDNLFERWLNRNVPVAYAYIKEHPEWKNLKITFEFWTSAPISEGMMTVFQNKQRNINTYRYSVRLRGPSEVWDACVNTREKNLIQTYKNHFMLDENYSPSH
ncbi:hypothetical protein [Ruegeria sp.]|uniref:hypothetical protein n=1 Tax=Ruegeria sp. TaxID=1879320 RepID=UPI003C7B04C1